MNVLRKVEIDTEELKVGDQIRVGHYTATCQKATQDGWIFMLDQYLDEPMQMKNDEDTNDGGYEASDLRKRLNSAEILAEFSGIELIPFRNGDLLRIPYYGEMFGHDDWYKDFAEPDDCEQWELMDHVNRIAYRSGTYFEKGWLQNKLKWSESSFCAVKDNGNSDDWPAVFFRGVRPVFLIGKKIKKVE